MRIHNSLRNNFLGIFIFSVLLFPGIVFAKYDVKGDTTGNINNYENGAGYYFDSKAGYYKDTDPKQANLTLFNSVQTRKQLSAAELSGLISKLGPAGLDNVKTNSLTTDNVYMINTGEETIFVYDPKIEADNPNNANDQLVIGMATKDAHLYVPKKAPLKESAEANEAFNDIDVDRGLQSGSTLARKNAAPLLRQERIAAQEVYDKALADKNAAQAALDSYQGTDAARRAELENAVRQANLAEQNAGRAANTIGNRQAQLIVQQQASATQANTTCGTSAGYGLVTNYFTINCFVMATSWVTNIIFKLSSFVAYITGTLFDYSLELSINSAEFFKKLGVIEVTWSFIRDILNMTFIFILLLTAVQILIGNEAKYNAKQVLTKVIIVAILINFSLFAAKLMVDGSNIVSLKIYEAMKSNTDAGNQNATISERIMNTVGLSTLYNITEVFTETNTKSVTSCGNNPGALITISVMGSIFLIILSLALGLAAILFLVRLVNIIFLFIKSPLWVWGYVLPGNSFVTKQKDEWWNQMKHVMTFPIAYLFWMLVAVIIFDSLGQAKNGGGLLEVICRTPGTQNGGAGAAISLVAIFCIVIIFMMKAIEYGVSHAAGPSGSIGGNFSKGIANKFSGYQTAMTKGLAKKAGLVTAGASIGAAKGSLKFAGRTAGRFAGAGIGALNKGDKDDSVWKRSKDGFFNSGITTKEALRDLARKTVVGTQGGALDYLGVTSAAAKLADKYKEPTNKDGKTKKEADAIRSEKAVADEKRRADAVDAQFKILSHADWKKKNASGTLDDYEAYAKGQMELRTNNIYGENIVNDVAANGSTHLENLRQAAIIRYEEDKRGADGKIEMQVDSSGNLVLDSSGKPISVKEQKIKFDEHAMRNGLQRMAKDDKVKTFVRNQKTKFTTFRNIKAEARLKALEGREREQGKKAKTKTGDEETTRRYEKEIPDLKDTIEKMEKHTAADIDAAILRGGPLTADPRTHYNGEKIRNINKAIAKRGLEAAKARPDASKLLDLDEKIIKAKEGYLELVKTTKEKLAKKEIDHMEHLAKLDEKK